MGVLFSGGKDSTYAAWVASRTEELSCLITMKPESSASYMFHFPNLAWTRFQADAMGVPQVVRRTLGVKEEELTDLRNALAEAKKEFGLEGVFTGAIASVYQKHRVEKICSELQLSCFSPLWGVDPEEHLHRLVRERFVILVVSVSALGLDESWLGRKIDDDSIRELVSLGTQFRFHIGLEGGEGETFVIDCPLFKDRIEIEQTANHWEGDRGFLEIVSARLVPKDPQKV